jgi:hypothetical protein
MTAIAARRTCDAEPLENARFCHGGSATVKDGDTRAGAYRLGRGDAIKAVGRQSLSGLVSKRTG